MGKCPSKFAQKRFTHHNKPHEDHIDWWTDYYRNIYSSEYGFAYEKLAYTAIKGHWGSIPLSSLRLIPMVSHMTFD